MKYRADFPERFGSFQDARGFCGGFSPWYNQKHHHSGLGFLTPFEVHFGQAEQRREKRALVLEQAFENNPERFVRGMPKPAALPTEVWINKPNETVVGEPSNASGVESSSVGGLSSENGFNISPISHERESDRDLCTG